MTAYISEIDTRGNIGNEFVEVAAPAGTDMSGFTLYIYDESGSVLSGPYGMGSLQATISGQDVYVLDNASVGLPGIRGENGVALVDDTGAVVQFVSFEGRVVSASDGPAAGLSSTDIGTQTSSGSLQSDDGGNSYYSQSTPNSGTVPCYAPGTLIETPEGQRAIETLRPGDIVITADNGPQEIRWISSKDHPLDGLGTDKRPVLIQAGALGPDLPNRDLIVSPQHRILVGAAGQLEALFSRPAFVPAKALTGLVGIRHMTGKSSITWITFRLRPSRDCPRQWLLGRKPVAGSDGDQRDDTPGASQGQSDIWRGTTSMFGAQRTSRAGVPQNKRRESADPTKPGRWPERQPQSSDQLANGTGGKNFHPCGA